MLSCLFFGFDFNSIAIEVWGDTCEIRFSEAFGLIRAVDRLGRTRQNVGFTTAGFCFDLLPAFFWREVVTGFRVSACLKRTFVPQPVEVLFGNWFLFHLGQTEIACLRVVVCVVVITAPNKQGRDKQLLHLSYLAI